MKASPVFSLRFHSSAITFLLSFAFVLGAATQLFSAPLSDAQSVTISGRVTDVSGSVLIGATVTLTNLATGLERTVTTDANGEFAFVAVRGERYRLTVSAAGFTPLTRDIETSAAAELTFTLGPAAIAEQVMVVSGSRQEELRESLNTRVEVIGRARIRDTGYESAAEVLREVPGVLTRRGSETAGAAGEQIQGIDSRQVLVLIDGQPIVGARGIKRGVLNLDRQSVGRLDRIEVVKGASSALYGSDAIGGVINLITRAPSNPLEASLTTSGGNFGVFDTRAEIGLAQKRVTGFFSFERHKNNGFDLTPTTFDTTGAGFHRYDALAKLKYQVTPTFSLSALVNSYWNAQRGRAVGELGPQTSEIDEESQNYGLTADWQIDPRTALQVRGYFARFDEVSLGQLAPPANTPLEPGNLFERLGKIDLMWSRILGKRQFLQAGGEWWTDRYRGFNRLRDDSGHRADTSVLWAQDRISLNRATVTLGLRYDHHSIFGSAASPKAGLNFRLAESWRLRASYGRGFRAPDLGQLFFRFLNPTNFYQVIGNPKLEPEHANSWQLGGEFTIRDRRARFGVNLFHNDVNDLIEAVGLGFIATPQQLAAVMAREGIDPNFRPVFGRLLFFYKNVANVRTQGIELDGELALPAGFGLGGAYTYLDAVDEDSRLVLTGRHRHQGYARLSWVSHKLGLRTNLRGTFYSSWIVTRSTRAGVSTETVAPRFALWDVYAAKSLRNGLEVFGAVDNLTDSQDPNTGLLGANGAPLPIFRPEAGRTFRLGLRWMWARERR
jgi:outer membrane receptor for ferrienterochelin and colicins